ncbi:MAG: TonB-dependent receptor [Candidatus Marinimicrobia bacterium]|nr:TonB-dependent receptor [Candidatus Neomarinimicrobiota bacterium]
MNLKTLLIVITIIISPLLSYGQLFVDITGKVVNANTGEPLPGANVLIEQTPLGGATDENGLFSIRNLPVGNYTISASVIGYEIQKLLIHAESKNITINFSLTSKTLEGENIIVSASRAITGKTPIAFSNIDSRTLSEKYSSQELPLLLDEVPSLYSYSFTGNGMGYSEIKIRGFDATRIAVTLNGVPLNDPEDHVTYFYDIADLSANIQDVQVQRGVGNSLYGTAAIGGSVNILTKGAGTEPGITLSGTSGSYNTRRLNFSFGTGYIENKYSAYGRFSKLETDGYRKDSGVDSWSYFLSGSRYDRDMTTTFNVFGGPLVAKFAWFGIGKDLLDDDDLRRSNFYSPDSANGFWLIHALSQFRIRSALAIRNLLQLCPHLFLEIGFVALHPPLPHLLIQRRPLHRLWVDRGVSNYPLPLQLGNLLIASAEQFSQDLLVVLAHQRRCFARHGGSAR